MKTPPKTEGPENTHGSETRISDAAKSRTLHDHDDKRESQPEFRTPGNGTSSGDEPGSTRKPRNNPGLSSESDPAFGKNITLPEEEKELTEIPSEEIEEDPDDSGPPPGRAATQPQRRNQDQVD